MSKAWHEANEDLLEFREAAVKRVVELKEEVRRLKRDTTHTTSKEDTSLGPSRESTLTTSSPTSITTRLPNARTFARTSEHSQPHLTLRSKKKRPLYLLQPCFKNRKHFLRWLVESLTSRAASEDVSQTSWKLPHQESTSYNSSAP